MAISSGTRLGPYEIVSAIGAGGMGEVYRAKDTRLDRTVAIKVLPSHLSSDPDLRQRFEREARAVSSLNHPHICTLHDVGHQEGIDYLVMEFLEGETVGDRLRKSSLSSELVLRYGIEIADALDKAHKQGIVHRDLKPGNIMLTKSGAKLLDFGLARFQPPVAQSVMSGVSALATEANKNLTAEGAIVGTFQYMAPEQLEGKDTDSRTDIFAFGTVLYEMITGQKAFVGKSQASLIAAILERDPPPISSIQPMTPPALDRVVKTCLAKDPDDRWQSAHDLMSEMKWIREGSSQAGVPAPVVTRRKMRERVSWLLALVFLLAAMALGLAYFNASSKPGSVMRLSVLPPENTTIGSSVISPDGKNLAIIAYDASAKPALWIRPIDSLTAKMLPETDDASMPFWSPNSRMIGFFAGDKMKKIDVSGQRPVTLCDSPNPKGGSWNRDGTIIFAAGTLINRVSSDGGQATPITKLEPREEADRWPCFLPDGRHFLFLGDAYRTEEHHLKVGSLDSTDSTRLTSSFISNVAYADAGFVLFVRQGGLMAQRFDSAHLQLSGEPFPLAEQVAQSGGNHLFDFSVSGNGVLTYRRLNPNSRLTWFDRSGNRLSVVGEPGRIVHLDLSPDEKRVAIEQLDADNRNGDIWILDLSRGTTTRFTFDPMWDNDAFWSPDGSRILFGSDRDISGPAENLYQKSSGGGGSDELLLKSDSYKNPSGWSPDGKVIVFSYSTEGTNNQDIQLFRLSDHQVIPYLHSEFNEYRGQISPDGKWMAYISDESGKPEVYVQSLPVSGAKWQISTGGAAQPRWRRDGKELFFIGGDHRLWAAEMKLDPAFEPGIPKQLFEVRVKYFSEDRFDYAVSQDGQRFLINALPEDATSRSINLVFNWISELKK
jgi:serine/threonine protein kinase